jgi:hypothetical protein
LGTLTAPLPRCHGKHIENYTQAILFYHPAVWWISGHVRAERELELIQQRLDQIRQAVPAVRDKALIEAAQAMTKVLVELIATLREGIADFDQQIARAVATHPDFAIFDSFPGAGPALAPRLLAAFGSQRERFQSAADLPEPRRRKRRGSGMATSARSPHTSWF